MTLSEIRNVLAERGIVLTKSLGQNFLHDGNQLRRIIEFGEIELKNHVLEVGPGLGPLTEMLLEKAEHVLAIEKDQRLVKFLENQFAAAIGSGRLALTWADALEFLREDTRDWSHWKLVSNLPYSVASPILVELAQAQHCPERLVATLQTEVAQRLVAGPGTSDYGLLTVLIQANYQPAGVFKIPAACFFPAPDVDSTCVRMLRRTTPALTAPERDTFTKVVKRSFSQRRKMMLKLLRADWPEDALLAGFERTGISHTERAEKVSVDQFVTLAKGLHNPGRSGAEVFDVVNERDQVIGRNLRAEVHRLGLMHRAVHVLIFNRVGQVYLQKRSMYKDRNPGVWDSSSSGHVDAGEDYLPCAVREIGEELGVAPAGPIKPLFKLSASPETDQEHVWVYKTSHEGPFALDRNEIECGDWFEPSDVTSQIAERPQDFSPSFRVIWERLEQP